MALDLLRLGKLLSLAGSAHEPEAIAALRKLKEHLSAEGLSFTDLGQKLIGQAPKASNGASRPPAPNAAP